MTAREFAQAAYDYALNQSEKYNIDFDLIKVDRNKSRADEEYYYMVDIYYKLYDEKAIEVNGFFKDRYTQEYMQKNFDEIKEFVNNIVKEHAL